MSSIIKFNYFENGEQKKGEIEIEKIPDTSDFEIKPVYKDKDGNMYMIAFDPTPDGGMSYTTYKYNEETDTATYIDHGKYELKKPWISGVWKARIGEIIYVLVGMLVVYVFLKYFNK